MKRILSLDGGGIRGVFSLQILKRIEEIFRQEHGKPELVLRDVFDFFAGTSTGAIIATFLAWGKSVAEIESVYVDHGKEMFDRAQWYARLKAKYNPETITNFLQKQFCEEDGRPATLGTGKFYASGRNNRSEDELPKTYLLVVMRNASTGSAWPVNNNPKAKYNLRTHPQCNLDIPLWQLLRASTAAPTFFPPESITLGQDQDRGTSIFVDGGITPYNNPALIAALMATLPRYHMNWESGPDKIQLVSVGTSQARTRLEKEEAERVNLLDQLTHVVPALLHSVGMGQDLLCRVLGDCVHGEEIDSEIGDLVGGFGPLAAHEKKFTYVRYNQTFTAKEVTEAERATKMPFALDNLQLIPHMQEAGRAYAKNHVRRGHFFPEKA